MRHIERQQQQQHLNLVQSLAKMVVMVNSLAQAGQERNLIQFEQLI